MSLRLAAVAVLCTAALATAHAQWLNYPAAGIPRTKDGKPNLTAPAPRANGKPDLSGVWTTNGSPPEEIEKLFPGIADLAVPGDDPRGFSKYFMNIFADYKNEDVPIKPEALQLLLARAKSLGKDNPTSHCLPAGIPMGELLPVPRRFIHLPNLLVILYEGVNPQRMIYLDGRKHVLEQPCMAWLLSRASGKVTRWSSIPAVSTIGRGSMRSVTRAPRPCTSSSASPAATSVTSTSR